MSSLCWFCGKPISGKLEIHWCGESKNCCEQCLIRNDRELWKQLQDKMDREYPWESNHKNRKEVKDNENNTMESSSN